MYLSQMPSLSVCPFVLTSSQKAICQPTDRPAQKLGAPEATGLSVYTDVHYVHSIHSWLYIHSLNEKVPLKMKATNLSKATSQNWESQRLTSTPRDGTGEKTKTQIPFFVYLSFCLFVFSFIFFHFILGFSSTKTPTKYSLIRWSETKIR